MMGAALLQRPGMGRLRLMATQLDPLLLSLVPLLLGLGLVMVTSASVTTADRQFHDPFHYLVRQGLFAMVGLLLGGLVLGIRLSWWQRASRVALFVALGILLLVLIPGLGDRVNGSRRWLNLVLFRLQVSELAKLLLLLYLSGYLVRHAEAVRDQVQGFLRPVAVMGLASGLLLMEPDFGAAAILLATALVLLFLAGVRWWQFGALALTVALGMGLLAVLSPYRMKRLTAFLDPWADPYNSGFQLTQSLIAIGRGAWTGVGLGGSVQKLFYLPEAHTDFVFAIWAEETGLVGVLCLLALFVLLVGRAFQIGAAAYRARQPFGAYLAWGIGTWIGLQTFVNLSVNMGLLPTKGLTLPFLSYGGSSLVVMCIALALLLRIDYERRGSVHALGRKAGRRRAAGRGRARR